LQTGPIGFAITLNARTPAGFARRSVIGTVPADE
jgi:hypothetical protein